LKKFYPKIKPPLTLEPTKKYGKTCTIKPGAFVEYFHKDFNILKGSIANKSTQKTGKGLELKSYNKDDQIVKIKYIY